MKATLDIQDKLPATAKTAAGMQPTTLTHLGEEGLSMGLTATDEKCPARQIALPVMGGKGGMRLGIDPTSNRLIVEAMN